MSQDELTAKTIQFYKNRLITECAPYNPHGIRYNAIEYLCSFPDIDPIEMAASLQNDGYNILLDDATISCKENASNRAKVNTAARRVKQ